MGAVTPVLVAGDDLDDYPISAVERLDSHYFIQFNHARYDRSVFRRRSFADPEVGFYGLELFFKSHGETPLGTLPRDDESIAFLLGLPLERWRGLMGREFNPLYNWYPVRCDNGEVRLAHAVVQEVMEAALSGHKEHKASNEEKAVWQRRNRLKRELKAVGCTEDLLNDDVVVGWLDDWLLEHHTGQRRAPQFQASIGRALKAAAQAGVLGRPGQGR